jgi:hypothetical protein
MLFVVAGVPGDLFQRFQQLIPSIFGRGHLVVAKPLRVRQDGRFAPGADYIDDIIKDLARRVERDPSITRTGCGAVILASPKVNIATALRAFYPFALPVAISLPSPALTIGEAGRRTMNRIAADVREVAVGLQRGVRSVTSEITARRNRTPLLLPNRNFTSDVFSREVDALFTALARSDAPSARISSACQRIERRHPFQPRGGACFYDDRGIRFRMPGRALHGRRIGIGQGHLPTCLLNGHLRLGGFSESGFHYDCTDGERGRLRGEFPDCHGTVGEYVGQPHLNIYPNDFIR